MTFNKIFHIFFLLTIFLILLQNGANGNKIEKENGTNNDGQGKVEQSEVVEETPDGRKVRRTKKITRHTIITETAADDSGDNEGEGQKPAKENGNGTQVGSFISQNTTTAEIVPKEDTVHTVIDWSKQRASSICGDSDWHFYDGFCYKLIVGKYNWAAALDECKNQNGSNLVSIHDQEENEFVAALSTKFSRNFEDFCNGFWIGMTHKKMDKEKDEFKSEWIDQSPVIYGDAPKKSPWREGQPDNAQNNADGKEECILMYPKLGCNSEPQQFYAQWNDYHCSAKLDGAVCKKRRPIH